MTTKRLAKELGLLRQRSASSSAQRSSVCKQRFSFLIIIDFESTCWREKSSSGQEIIEFPAVLLSVCSGAVESEFHSYVQPQERPVLSAFCTELTGITQDQVDSAPPLHIVLSRFSRWLRSLQEDRGVVFLTDSSGAAPSAQLCAFVTWSDWDLGVCLLYECKRKQLSVPEALKNWIDLRATYKLFYNRKPKGLRGALLDLGIEFTGREHSGLVDARNTALLAQRMMTDGCQLSITSPERRAQVKPRPHTRPSGLREPHTHLTNVMNSRDTHTNTHAHLTSVKSSRDTHTHTNTHLTNVKSSRDAHTRLPALMNGSIRARHTHTQQTCANSSDTHIASASVCEVLVSPFTLLSAAHTHTHLQARSAALAGLSDTTYDPESPAPCWQDGELLVEEEEPSSYDDVILGAEPEEATPSEHRRCVSSSVFKTPPPLLRSEPLRPLTHSLGRIAAPLSVHAHTHALKQKVKVTSPLCVCGRRARRLTVGNGGPNHGRVFYCCPRRRSNTHTHTCDFFQWESGVLQNTLSMLTTHTPAAAHTHLR
uniref:ERI1 exoribonuclease 2 n=1 Tax=Danio rerio TaxID=7955 RepID=UPI003D966C41